MEKIKVLFLVPTNLFSYRGGIRTRIISEMNSFGNGIEVSVLCILSSKDFFKRKEIKQQKEYFKKRHIRIKVFPTVPFYKSFFSQKLNSFFVVLFASIFVKRKKIQIIHAQTTNAGQYATMIKNRLKSRDIKVVNDIHGVMPEEYLYKIGSRNSLTTKDEKILKSLEKKEIVALDNADWNIYVSEAMNKHFSTKYSLNEKKYTVIPCAINSKDISDFSSRIELRNNYGVNDKIVFIYLGSLVAYQMIDDTLKLFKKINEKIRNSFLFLVTHEKEKANNLLKKYQIDIENTKILSIANEKIANFLTLGDFGFLLRNDSIVNKVASPVKFGEYIYSGLQVITTKNVGDISYIVKDNNLGFIYDLENDNIDSLIDYIEDTLDKKEDIFYKNKKYAVEDYSWAKYSKLIVSIYKNLI